jgi:hypothetical protein
MTACFRRPWGCCALLGCALLGCALLFASCAMDDRAEVLRLKVCDEGRCARGFACVEGTCLPNPGTEEQSAALQQQQGAAMTEAAMTQAADLDGGAGQQGREPSALPAAKDGGAFE